MAEHIMWRESGTFSNSGETAEPVEFAQEEFSEENLSEQDYRPDDMVRVYIQTDGTYSMETVIEKISVEVLKGEKLDVHNRRPEDGILTADISYEQIASIEEVEGVAFVELVGRAEQTGQENEHMETGMQGSIPVSKIAGAAAIVLTVIIIWMAVRNYQKRKGKKG